jgi:hypothetical protein
MPEDDEQLQLFTSAIDQPLDHQHDGAVWHLITYNGSILNTILRMRNEEKRMRVELSGV